MSNSFRGNDIVNPRVTTAFGTARGGQKLLRGIFTDLTQYEFATASAVKIYFYNRAGRRLGELSSEHYNRQLLDVNFELVENGCGSASIELAEYPSFSVELGTYIEVFLYQSTIPWYSGIIMKVPSPATFGENSAITLEVFGFYQLLEQVILKTAATKPTQYGYTNVTSAAYDIAVNFIGPNLSVGIDPNRFEPSSYVATELDFELAHAKKALKDLADLSRDYIFGIDAKRKVFFRARRTKSTNLGISFLTHNIEKLEVIRDLDSVVNRLYVKSGSSRGDAGQGTNLALEDPIEDVDSQRIYGVREKVETVPTLVNTTDVDQWGQWFIDQHSEPEETVTIRLTDIGTIPYVPGDSIRVNSDIRSFVSLGDAFDDADIDPAWSVVNSNGSYFEELTSKSAIRVFPGSSTTGNEPFMYKRAVGDFSFDLTVTPFGDNGDDGGFVAEDAIGLHVRQSSSRRMSLLIRRVDTTSLSAPPQWYLERQDTFDGTTIVSTTTVQTVTSYKLGIERRDGMFYTTWGNLTLDTTLYPPTQPFSSSRPVYIGFAAYTGNNSYAFGVTTPYYDIANFNFAQKSVHFDYPLRSIKYRVKGGVIVAEASLGFYEQPEGLRQDRNLQIVQRDIWEKAGNVF
jgi:hypothetical protein